MNTLATASKDTEADPSAYDLYFLRTVDLVGGSSEGGNEDHHEADTGGGPHVVDSKGSSKDVAVEEALALGAFDRDTGVLRIEGEQDVHHETCRTYNGGVDIEDNRD